MIILAWYVPIFGFLGLFIAMAVLVVIIRLFYAVISKIFNVTIVDKRDNVLTTPESYDYVKDSVKDLRRSIKDKIKNYNKVTHDKIFNRSERVDLTSVFTELINMKNNGIISENEFNEIIKEITKSR